MSVTRSDELSEILDGIRGASAGVRAAYLATAQGSFIASTEMSGMERLRLGGISAASLAIGAKGIADLKLGNLNEIHVAGDEGSFLVLSVGRGAVMTLVLDRDCDVDAIAGSAKSALPRLESAI